MLEVLGVRPIVSLEHVSFSIGYATAASGPLPLTGRFDWVADCVVRLFRPGGCRGWVIMLVVCATHGRSLDPHTGVRAVHRALSSLRPMFAHTSSHATPWS